MTRRRAARSDDGEADMNMDRGMMVRINRAVGIVSVVIGLAVMSGAGIWAMQHRSFMRDAAVAHGQVVANVEKEWTSTSSSGSTTRTQHSYCSVVHYVDRAGAARTFEDNICFNPPSFRVGDVVTVRYDADRTHVMIDRGDKVYLVPLAVAVFGTLCLVGGVQRLAGRGLPPVVDVPDVPIVAADPSTVYRSA
jgi:hypothetical protein